MGVACFSKYNHKCSKRHWSHNDHNPPGGAFQSFSLSMLSHFGNNTPQVHQSMKTGQNIVLKWLTSAVQKNQKLSESPTTVPIVAKLCFINCKSRKITKRFVQPVTPGGYPKRPFYNVKMKEKWPILNIM